MQFTKFDKAWIFGLLFVLAFAAALGSAVNVQADVPGPLAAPTPVTVSASGPSQNDLSFFTTRVITQDVASAAQNIEAADKADLQYTLDQTLVTGIANTTTLTLQFSCDGTTWTNGVAMLSANVADASDISQMLTFCSQMRVLVDVSNTNPVTVTVQGLAK